MNIVQSDGSIEEIKNQIKELELFLGKWNEYLKQPVIDDESILEANKMALDLETRTEIEIKRLEELIFDGSKPIFEKNKSKLETSVLGVISKNSILSSSQMNELMILCEFPVNQKWTKLYKATKDGFDASAFHSKCDKKENTLIIIKSANGYVFGGYTEQSWEGQKQGKYDKNAFIFSFINKKPKCN